MTCVELFGNRLRRIPTDARGASTCIWFMKLTPPFIPTLVFASLPVHSYLRGLLHDAVEVFWRGVRKLGFRLAGLSYSFVANLLDDCMTQR